MKLEEGRYYKIDGKWFGYEYFKVVSENQGMPFVYTIKFASGQVSGITCLPYGASVEEVPKILGIIKVGQ